MMNQIKFSIPWINDLKYLQKIILNKNCKIYEVFYRPNDLLLGKWKKSKEILNFLRKEKISLAMTTTQRSGIFDFNKSFEEYLKKTKVVPDRLIVDYSSIDIVSRNKLVKKNNIRLYISTIMGIKTLEDVKMLIILKNKYPQIDSVCLHHDSTKDEHLKKKVNLLIKNNIESILLVNESCFFNCPFRAEHYSYLKIKFNLQKDPYQIFCVKDRLKQKNIFGNLAGYIHPKKLSDYNKRFGIKYFKITGQPSSDRKRTLAENKKTINAYLFGKIPQNSFEIIVFTYLKHPISKILRLNGNNDQNVYKIDRFTKSENKLYNDFLKIIKINNIYKKYGDKLPWIISQLPPVINNELNKISRLEKILVVGCGLGQHLPELKKMGFKEIWATDLSSFAITEVRKNYPFAKSFSCPTEELYKNNLKGFIVLDIHNMHQVNPNELKNYLKSLGKISKKLILSWIHEPERGNFVKSDIPEFDNIYHHDLKTVKTLLMMDKKSEFHYKCVNNQALFQDNKKHINKIIGGVFIASPK